MIVRLTWARSRYSFIFVAHMVDSRQLYIHVIIFNALSIIIIKELVVDSVHSDHNKELSFYSTESVSCALSVHTKHR